MLISVALSLLRCEALSLSQSCSKKSSAKIFSGSLRAVSKVSLITKQGGIPGLQVYTQQDILFHNHACHSLRFIEERTKRAPSWCFSRRYHIRAPHCPKTNKCLICPLSALPNPLLISPILSVFSM